jgi:hypothetical protein
VHFLRKFGAIVAFTIATVSVSMSSAQAAKLEGPTPSVKYGTYPTLARCESVAAPMDRAGVIIGYTCSRALGGWELWVRYR